MIKDGIKITDMNNIINAFNEHFVNIGSQLASTIVTTDNIDASSNIIDNGHSLFHTETTEKEIIEIVNKCKSKRSTDWNDLDMSIIKKVIKNIANPLTHICNQSLSTGKFPKLMKIAKVAPIYKNYDSHQFTNYRTISILPQLSKILEKIFVARLNGFIDKHNLLSDSQYGFRNNRSTSLALIDLMEEITDRQQDAFHGHFHSSPENL